MPIPAPNPINQPSVPEKPAREFLSTFFKKFNVTLSFTKAANGEFSPNLAGSSLYISTSPYDAEADIVDPSIELDQIRESLGEILANVPSAATAYGTFLANLEVALPDIRTYIEERDNPVEE